MRLSTKTALFGTFITGILLFAAAFYLLTEKPEQSAALVETPISDVTLTASPTTLSANSAWTISFTPAATVNPGQQIILRVYTNSTSLSQTQLQVLTSSVALSSDSNAPGVSVSNNNMGGYYGIFEVSQQIAANTPVTLVLNNVTNPITDAYYIVGIAIPPAGSSGLGYHYKRSNYVQIGSDINLTGTVSNVDGTPVILATIKATDLNTGTVRYGALDKNGRYGIGGLASGTYNVEIPYAPHTPSSGKYPGPATVTVTAGTNTTQDFKYVASAPSSSPSVSNNPHLEQVSKDVENFNRDPLWDFNKRINGKILRDGQPAGDVDISAAIGSTGPGTYTRSNADGTYSIPLRHAGKFNLILLDPTIPADRRIAGSNSSMISDKLICKDGSIKPLLSHDPIEFGDGPETRNIDISYETSCESANAKSSKTASENSSNEAVKRETVAKLVSCLESVIGEELKNRRPNRSELEKAFECFVKESNVVPVALAPVDPNAVAKLPKAPKIVKVEIPAPPDKPETDFEIKGKAAVPGSTVFIYLQSKPRVYIQKADAAGNWSYKVKDTLETGVHKVYAIIEQSAGKYVSSEPISFEIKKAAAAVSTVSPTSSPEPQISPSPVADTVIIAPHPSEQSVTESTQKTVLLNWRNDPFFYLSVIFFVCLIGTLLRLHMHVKQKSVVIDFKEKNKT